MQQYFIKGYPKDIPFHIHDKDTSKHMFQVMRLSDGDEFVAVFEDGIKYLARVVNKETQMVEVVHALTENTELPSQVTIAMGFPKGDKLEFLAQKVTELGATQLWAYPADWSVVKWDAKKLVKKAEKLEKIVQGAAQQSKRNQLPKIKLFDKKQSFLDCLGEFDEIVVAYEEVAKSGEKSRLLNLLKSFPIGSRILFIVGPEGGLSPNEITLFKQAGARLVGLGPRILRTETAPLYLLTAVSLVTE